jgi:mannose-6-phosphate isomerase-like protein (cupin superfamily)
MIVFTENKYPIAKDISWDDVIEKISQGSSKMVILHENTSPNPPTFFLMDDYYPGTIGDIFEEVSKDCGVEVMHMYTSFGMDSTTFGNHNDPVDVLLVQAKGRTSYRCDDVTYILNPGDSLFIPKESYHEPIISGPRVTLSFSWE